MNVRSPLHGREEQVALHVTRRRRPEGPVAHELLGGGGALDQDEVVGEGRVGHPVGRRVGGHPVVHRLSAHDELGTWTT